MNLPSTISLLVFLVLAASASTSGQEDGAAVEPDFDFARSGITLTTLPMAMRPCAWREGFRAYWRWKSRPLVAGRGSIAEHGS
jgi:hypothetical protein